MLLIQRTRGAVALHGNDTDRCRTDFEPKQKIQRHSQAIRQCNSDDIGVAYPCEGQARLAYAQPLDGGKHPRLNLNHQLASRKREQLRTKLNSHHCSISRNSSKVRPV